MTTFTYNLANHFSATDIKRLDALATSQQKSLGDLIEVTLKRAIFTAPPASSPKKRTRKA